MRRIIVLFTALLALGFISTSCTQYGCPGHISKDYQFDKELKEADILVLSADNLECIN